MKNTQHKMYMNQLEKAVGLTFDGGDDTRLFDEIIYADTLSLTKKQYKKMEAELNKFLIKGMGFIVYAWNDVSGYNYWTKQMQEDNYIQITADIENAVNVDVDELEIAINVARQTFQKYARE